MKRISSSVLVWVVISALAFNFYSCGEEKNSHPDVAFMTSNSTVSYISKDTGLVHGTIFNIGIDATKKGSEGLLTTCKISRSVNQGVDSTIQEINFVSDFFSQSFTYTAGDSGNVEKYTFTIGEKSGLTSSVSLTITDL